MPSKTPAQARLMAAAAHTPGGYGGVPQSVGRDFNRADKGSKLLSRANSKRGYADGGIVSGSEYQPPEQSKPITEEPTIRAVRDIAKAASFTQPTTSQSESERRTLGKAATGVRG